jgi:tetratricopeptide (TPR) repeat protein
LARRATLALLLLAVIAATTAAHRRIPDDVRTQRGDAYVPRPEFAKALSLGFDAVLADYYWVQAVLLVGGSNNPQKEATQLGRLVDVVTTLDPWVDHPYRFGAVWLDATLEDVRHGNMLLRRSFPYHPDEWRNRFYLGFNLFYYLEDHAGAAEILHEASQLPGSPAYLPRLVARLRSEVADLDAAGMFLEELVRTTEDEARRAGYQAALDEITIEWRARELDRAREAYQKLHGVDIEFVEQLALGAKAVLPRLPDPEPPSLPLPLRRGSKWEIDEESGQIVSSYYGRRYEVHVDAYSRTKLETMRRQDEPAAPDSGEGRGEGVGEVRGEVRGEEREQRKEAPHAG